MLDNAPNLDTDAIKNAAELLNATLLAKGYLTEPLLFNCIDGSALHGEDREPKVTTALYNNDKNIINILYSLTQSIERNLVQNRVFNKIVNQKDHQIQSLKKQIETHEVAMASTERQLVQYQSSDRAKLTQRISELTATNRNLSLDVLKLKNYCTDVQTKYAIQMKKKNIEIDQLKDKLIEKSLTHRATNGNAIFPDANATVVFNNSPAFNNDNAQSKQATGGLDKTLKREYEDIIVDLSKMIENLILETLRFSQFVRLVTSYFTELNLQISTFNTNKTEIEIPNPSASIDLDSIAQNAANGKKDSSDLLNELESFDAVSKPLLENVYKNYHYISDLVAETQQNQEKDPKQISKLKNELEVVRQNWQEAINTLNNWKRYKEPGPDS